MILTGKLATGISEQILNPKGGLLIPHIHRCLPCAFNMTLHILFLTKILQSSYHPQVVNEKTKVQRITLQKLAKVT